MDDFIKDLLKFVFWVWILFMILAGIFYVFGPSQAHLDCMYDIGRDFCQTELNTTTNGFKPTTHSFFCYEPDSREKKEYYFTEEELERCDS